MKYILQELKHFLEYKLYHRLSRKNSVLKTAIQSVFSELEVKNYLPKDIHALEMFGRNGLWVTLGYVDYVQKIDFFELEQKFSKQAKYFLKKYPVDVFCEDSIKYVQSTDKTYNFILADCSLMDMFFDSNGLISFYEDIVKISDKGAVITFNFHTKYSTTLDELKNLIRSKTSNRIIQDVFVTPRTQDVFFVTVVLD